MKKLQNQCFGVLIFGAVYAFITLTQCDSGTNPQPPAFTGPLELLQPKGGSGQSFKVGDPVTIKWSIHDRSRIGSVAINYSLDNGKTWTDSILGENVIVNVSLTYPETTYAWTPTASQKSKQFVLKVREYNDRTLFDKSAPFVIQ